MRRKLVIPAAILLVQLCVNSLAGAEQGYLLSADAIPASIVADGKSYSQIVVAVTQPGGLPVPDGAEVRLATTSGVITPVAYTGAGRANAILTSTSSPGVAFVTASVGGASASVQVEFTSAEGDEALGPKVLRMRGGSLAFSVERDVILASDNVTLEYRGLTITATNAQVSDPLGVIKAQGQVRVSRGKDMVEADALVYDLRTDRCRILRQAQDAGGSEVHTVSAFRADDLRPSPMAEDASDFEPLEAVTSKTWIVSRKLAMFPGEKIQFFRASIYLRDSRVITLPHYFYSYDSRGSILQQFRYTAYQGLVLDVPLYYRVADSGSGALKLRYAGKGTGYGGYSQPRKGLSLALDQAYSLGERSDGRIFVDALNDEERSLELAHHLEFGSPGRGSGRADFTARFQPSSAFAKGMFTACLNVFGAMGRYDYNVSSYMSGSRIPTWNPLNPEDVEYSRRTSGSILLAVRERRSFSAGKRMSLSPDFAIGYGHPGYSSGARRGACLYQSVGLNFYSAPVRSRALTLSFDGSSDLTMTADGRTGVGLRAGANLRRFWRGGSATLSYTLNLSSGPACGFYSTSAHTIGGTFFLSSGRKWNCYTYFGYGLDTGRANLYSYATYNLSDLWRLRANYSFFRYSYKVKGRSVASDSSYLKVGVFRPVGPYEIGVAWSPNGQYGFGDSKRVWLEVGAQGF